ncbi:MAG: hypothetical protein ACI8S3_001558 [Alphaproteobacteria bacterium]|jgi:hypothetical protein
MIIKNLNMNFAATLRGLAIAGLAGGMIALAAAPAAHAQSVEKTSVDTAQPTADISREYLIKAAILFNFAKVAAWPEAAFSNPGAPLRICVLGDDPFGTALDTLNGKQVRDRPLATKRIADVQDATPCHILFVSASEKARLSKILDHVAQLPILTVADINRFASAGGIIALKAVHHRSRIEVNMGAADQAGVKLSSKLLRLADKAETLTQTGDASTGFNSEGPANADTSL